MFRINKPVVEKNTLYFLISVTIVIIVNVFTRIDVLWGETFIADDLIYATNGLLGECHGKPRAWISNNVLCFSTSFGSLFWSRLFYIVLLAGCAAFYYRFMTSFGLEEKVSAVTSIAIFAGVSSISQVTFITGSYPSIALLFMLLACFFVSLALFRSNSKKFEVFYFSIALVAMFFATATSSLLSLLSLALVPVAMISGQCRLYRKRSMVLVFIAIIPALTMLFMEFSGIWSNHYLMEEGTVSISLDRVIIRTKYLVNLLYEIYNINFVKLLFAVLGLSILIYAFGLFSILKRNHRGEHYSFNESNARLIALLGFSIAGFIVSFVPPLTVAGSAYRYIFVPMLFLVTLPSILLTLFVHRFHKAIFVHISLALVVFVAAYSVYSLIIHHERVYGDAIEGQPTVNRYLASKKDVFKENAQILVVLESGTTNVTSAFHHWSTHFIRYVTGRKDLVGIIGETTLMREFPFVGEYKDHDEKYWGIKGGRQYRKKMVGLELQNRPTYIVRFVDGAPEELGCIFISNSGEWSLYLADQKGTQLEWKRRYKDFLNPQKEIQRYSTECANYTIGGAFKPNRIL